MKAGNQLFSDVPRNRMSGWIVANDMDVRMFLATGVIPHAKETTPITPRVDPSEAGWRWLGNDELNGEIAVYDERRACLLYLKDVCSDKGYLNQRIPASNIAEIKFASERSMNDWVVKSNQFEGLPKCLPKTSAGNSSLFTKVENESGSWGANSVKSDLEESDNCAGLITALIAIEEVNPDVMEFLGTVSRLEKDDAVHILHKSFGIDTNSLRVCLGVLAEATWHEGFDPTELLQRLTDVLSDTKDKSQVKKWNDYTSQLLNNQIEEKAGSLLDEGDLLLRSLQLVLRTTPLKVSEIEKQINVRGELLGERVGRLALLFAAWLEGFGALGDMVKQKSEVYGIGSRTATNSSDYPLQFQVKQSKGDTKFEEITTLYESDVELVAHKQRPCAEFMHAYYSAEFVCAEHKWNLSYVAADPPRMRIEVGNRTINAEVPSQGQITWWAEMTVGKRPRARVWPKEFISKLLKSAASSRCVISSATGYPNVEFRSYQLLHTMDRAEVEYHIQGIISSMDSVEEIGNFTEKMKPID